MCAIPLPCQHYAQCTMYVHKGITLTKRQSARLIRTIDIKTYFYLSAQNPLCTMQLLHKKVKRYIIQKDQIIHH